MNTFRMFLMLAFILLACSHSKPHPFLDTDSGTDIVPPFQNCDGLQCLQAKCSAGRDSTISGTIYDPSGSIPLYGAIIYVPNRNPDPITDGASCGKCSDGVSGDPINSALSDTDGKFKLGNMPVGTNIPVVIQIGKWRKQFTVQETILCGNVEIEKEKTHLPRNKKEGDIPKIALVTGGCDALECLLRRIGIDDSEFTGEGGTGSVHLFQGYGGGGLPTSNVAEALWSNDQTLLKYDVVLMDCECSEFTTNKPPISYQMMKSYLDKGGRIFGSHYQYVWLQKLYFGTANWQPMGNPPDPLNAQIDTSFPKGRAMADWMYSVGGADQSGLISLHDTRWDVNFVYSPAQQWIYAPDPQSVYYYSFNTPPDAAEEDQCGRVVYSDLHVSGGDVTGRVFPGGCTTGILSPQEKALEFMLFDITSCLRPDSQPPVPPIR